MSACEAPAEDNLVTASATSASTSVAGTRTIDPALDVRHMRRAISRNNQLPSAMPKGQRTKGLASKGIDQLPCFGDEPVTLDAAALRVELLHRPRLGFPSIPS
jgi:hypothetical protein